MRYTLDFACMSDDMNICNDYVPFVKFACSDVYSCTACLSYTKIT